MKLNYLLILISAFIVLSCTSKKTPKTKIILTNSKIVDKTEVNKKEIILATDSWAPFYSPNLENNGFFTEIVKTAFKRVGYDCKIKFFPWKRALEQSKLGNYHGLLGVFYKEDRKEFYKYSSPIYKSNMVFFSLKKKNIKYNNLKDLSKYKVGTIRGYHYSKDFDTLNIKKEEVTSVEQNIYKLLNKRIDLFIDSKEVVLWLLKTKFSKERDLIKTIYPPLVNKDLYVAVSKKIKNHEEIINKLNKGLKLIQEDGTYNKIIERHFKKIQCSLSE